MQVGRKQRWFLAMAKNWVNRWGPCDCFRGLRRGCMDMDSLVVASGSRAQGSRVLRLSTSVARASLLCGLRDLNSPTSG